ncbi:hypothetical protein E4U53_006196 [Claviceps sorghi]|nr:hypothetical protein E4U53_006196 [Claviceps sorghi]
MQYSHLQYRRDGWGTDLGRQTRATTTPRNYQGGLESSRCRDWKNRRIWREAAAVVVLEVSMSSRWETSPKTRRGGGRLKNHTCVLQRLGNARDEGSVRRPTSESKK